LGLGLVLEAEGLGDCGEIERHDEERHVGVPADAAQGQA
jgi:hypothetical protein